MQEALYYCFFYLTPLVVFACNLAAMPANSEFRFEAEWECVLSLATAFVWVVRHINVECKQLTADGFREYIESFWNGVDVATILLFAVTALTYLARAGWMDGPIYCKQVTAFAMILAFLKSLHCAQTIPSLARLVQLIIATVSKMRDFLAIFWGGKWARAAGGEGGDSSVPYDEECTAFVFVLSAVYCV